MNREDLFREIGNIDDDLILAASEARGRSLRPMLAGLAACLLLVCGIWYGARGDTIYFNTAPSPAASKVTSPAGEEPISVSCEELLIYYSLDSLPQTLFGDLARTEQSRFTIAQDQTCRILYTGADVTLTVTLSKAGAAHEDLRRSTIDDVSVLLATTPDGAIHWALFHLNNTEVQLTATGLTEDAFVQTVRELIGSL